MGVNLLILEPRQPQKLKSANGALNVNVQQHPAKIENQVLNIRCKNGFQLHCFILLNPNPSVAAPDTHARHTDTLSPSRSLIWNLGGKNIFLQTHSQILHRQEREKGPIAQLVSST